MLNGLCGPFAFGGVPRLYPWLDAEFELFNEPVREFLDRIAALGDFIGGAAHDVTKDVRRRRSIGCN